MTTMGTCVICQKRPPAEGFDPLSDSKEIPATERHANTAPTESALELCRECGALIVPYKIGRNTITSGHCRICNQKLKYGSDWEPGRKEDPLRRSEYQRKKYLERKKAKKQDKDNGGTLVTSTLTIAFMGDDEDILRSLEAIAAKERRSIEQQVLYFLDRALEI